MQTLKPVEISEFYIKQVSSGLKKYFWDNIFSKIFEILDDKRNFVINAKDYLEEAIKSGRVYYENGAFRTQYAFSNNVAHQLESLGAKFKYQAYFIERSTLPLNIEQAIVFKSIQEAQKIERLNAFLASLYGTLDAIRLEEYIELAVQKMYKKLEVDLLASTGDKKVPVVEFGFDASRAKLPDSILDELDRYWKDKDQEIKDKKDKIKDLKAQLKDLKSKAKKKPKDNKLPKTDGTEPPTDDSSAPKDEPTTPPSDTITPSTDETPQEPKTEDGKTQGDLEDEINQEQNALKNLQDQKQELAPKAQVETLGLDKESQKIAQDYTHNMKYWVKGWEAKNIVKMREDVLKMVQQGARVPTIKKYLMDKWGTAERKAEFLARNESNLAGSVVKATYYQNKGYTSFQWLRSSAKCKRKLHQHYYGKIFRFDDPPIIEELKTKQGKELGLPDPLGQRGLPRQTYNCLCHWMPVADNDFFKNSLRIKNAKRNIFTKIKYKIQNSKQCNNNSWRYRRYGEGQEV